MIRSKSAAATLSVASNSVLIALKLAAGAITGSIAILTEALHSSIDLLASVIALVSVRKADEPADAEHPYGHEKVENLAAAIEGMLILVGAGIIVYEATRRLVVGAEVENLGVGIAVIAVSAVANFAVSALLRRRAREHDSPALEGDAAHLHTDALTSLGSWSAWPWPRSRARPRSTQSLRWSWPWRSWWPGSAFSPVRARAGRRGPASGGAGPDRGGDRRRAPAGDGRLPQAPCPPGRRPPSHRPARAVPLRHHAGAGPRAGARLPGRSRARSRPPTC